MSWQSEFKDAIRSHEELVTFFDIVFPKTKYPIFIPKSFGEKIKIHGLDSILAKQFLPQAEENQNQIGRLDPIGDLVHAKGNQLIHRYQNRVLFTPTTVCPVLCRYCFRKNELAEKNDIFNQNYSETLDYLKKNPTVNEVIFTGGDPLILSNEKLAGFIQDFSEIDSIQFIRFHTRTPIILPSRIDEGFLAVMKSSSEIFKRSMLMIHINHGDELDGEVVQAINLLTDLGIEVFSQTVLLKGINDSTEILEELFTRLAEIKVKPYYLHHPDEALGAMHFYLPLEEGRRIFWPLHNKLPGWALPQYVIDIPGGEGKVPALNPESFRSGRTFLNRLGEEITY